MSKVYIKDGKIFRSPIVIKTASGTTYTNNEDIIIANGFEVYKPEPDSKETQVNIAIESINKETDRRILNDFVYNDCEFYLTVENQTNFANMFVARDFLEYPQKIKTKTGYMDINSKEEVQSFYLAGVQFVKKCLEDGWREKDAATARIMSEGE